MFTGEDGGAIFGAIRACNGRIDSQMNALEDIRARIRTQDWYHEISEQEEDEEMENQLEVENRSSNRRRPRGHARPRRTMRQWTRPVPRPPLQETNAQPSPENERHTEGLEVMRQAMQRLFVAYNQCTHRVAQTDDRMEQFRSNLRRDALELTMNVKRIEQDLQYQFQATARMKQSLHNDVLEGVKSLEEKMRFMVDHETHVNQTIDRNAHSQCASIEAIIAEQGDIRRSTNALLEINDLKSKVTRLTEQNTKLEGQLSYLSSLSDQMDALWKCLPPGTGPDGTERVVTAVEVQDEMDEF